jgi:hypothetical protein
MENNAWTFSTLADLWEYRNGAIVAGGDRLDAMPEPERQRSLAKLNAWVRSQVAKCDDGALATVAPARSALVAARQRRCTRRTLVSTGARAGGRALTRTGAGGACWAFAAGWFAGWSHGASHAAGPPDCQKEKGADVATGPPLSFGWSGDQNFTCTPP